MTLRVIHREPGSGFSTAYIDSVMLTGRTVVVPDPGWVARGAQAIRSRHTWPWTSVRRRSRPLQRKVSFSWSIPSWWRTVAHRS